MPKKVASSLKMLLVLMIISALVMFLVPGRYVAKTIYMTCGLDFVVIGPSLVQRAENTIGRLLGKKYDEVMLGIVEFKSDEYIEYPKLKYKGMVGNANYWFTFRRFGAFTERERYRFDRRDGSLNVGDELYFGSPEPEESKRSCEVKTKFEIHSFIDVANNALAKPKF